MTTISAPQLPFDVARADNPAHGIPLTIRGAKETGVEETRQAFQKFVAGTFYKQMLKSLRQTQGQPAYFHGGQAEEVFRGQMDQEVAEQLAETRGATFSDSLFDAFANQLRLNVQSESAGKEL